MQPTIYWEGQSRGRALFAIHRSLLPEAKQHLVPPDEGKAGDVSLARQQDEEAELLAEVDALSGSDRKRIENLEKKYHKNSFPG